MSINASLTDFSLPEILQFIEKGHKTGLLKLRPLPELQATLPRVYYIWVNQGHIVAAANRLDQQGLVKLIEQHQEMNFNLVAKVAQFCPIDQPLGLCLKNQGILQIKQLKHLFKIQVLQTVCALFLLKEGQLIFEQNVPMPTREMTGLSIPTTALNRYALMKVLLEKIENRCLNSTELMQLRYQEASSRVCERVGKSIYCY
jgi:hypothetical protein